MKLFTKEDFEKYQSKDILLSLLSKYESKNDDNLISHRWLKNDIVKRYIFQSIYKDLLEFKDLKIIDVGGGYTSLTKYFINNHNYNLIDIMSHDSHSFFKKYSKKIGLNWINSDWFDYKIEEDVQIVIVNDLFPNVDQRMDLFIEKFLPRCEKLIMSLTFYNNDKFYKVKRLDAEEILFLKAYNGTDLFNFLKNHVSDLKLSFFQQDPKNSLFPNGRSVIKITLIKK